MRARSSRSRRPPKQFQGTLSWEEARDLVKSKEQDEENDNRIGNVMTKEAEEEEEKMDEADDHQDGVVYDRDDLEDLSLEEDMDNIDDDDDDSTGDEFVPDTSKRKHGRLHREDFSSNGSSNEQQLDMDQPDTVDSSLALRNELTISQRLDRARRRRWHPPLGHGGMENPADWREAGQRKRELQMQTEGGENDDDADLEVEGEELQ